MTFEEAVAFVLRPDVEGVESNDPEDDGGLTRFGISSVAHPDIDVRGLTREDAIEVYRTRFWTTIRGDELSNGLRLAVFDGAVQHSPRRSIKLLQQSLRVTADGVIGLQTLTALGHAEWHDLLADFLSRRMLLYAGHPDWPTFGRGWSKRLFLLYQTTLGDLV